MEVGSMSKIKLVNIGQAGCGQYRAEQDGKVIGEVRRTNRASYVDATGKAWPVSVVVWVAEDLSGRVVAVRRTRDDVLDVLACRPAVVNGVAR
jgi:hypothetical protein